MSATQEQIEKLRTLQESYDELANKYEEIKHFAKQGDNPDATNSKILDEVRSKLTPLEAVLTELNNGKQEMVAALATKSVQSSIDKTLSAIASDVRSIPQSHITIEGGEIYEKQLFGAPTDKTNAYEQPNSPMWNLYQVMANLLSDGRFVKYGGILLGEYAKDSDTVVLNMAGAGGAYFTSDGYLYEVDTEHTWDDKHDGKSNRWVAYLFNEQWKDVTISHSNLTSIHIGRKVGIISFSTNTFISEVVVTDGNYLKSFNSKTYLHGFSNNFVIKNITEQSGILVYGHPDRTSTIRRVYVKAGKISGPLFDMQQTKYQHPIRTLIIECEELNAGIYNANQRYTSSLKELYITARKINTNFVGSHNIPAKFNPNYIIFKGVEEASITGTHYNSNAENISDSLKYIYIGYDTNDKTKSVSFTTTRFDHVEDVELQYGWCKPFTFNPIVDGRYTFSNLTEENMINHILKRLKQDEEMCGSGVTITLGATNLAKLTSEEAVALLDSLTNIYGYTFA